MITKVDNSIENLKNLWIEIFLDSTNKVSNIADGSVLNATAFGTAKVAQKAIKDIAITEAKLFPDTATGEYLDKCAALYGVSPRRSALGSSTYIRVFAAPGTIYNEDTIFVNKNGIRFQVDQPLTVGPSGYGYVGVRSINAGYVTNVAPNSITTVNPQPIGHIECTNEYYAIGGRDSEDDETFRVRIKNNLNVLSKGTIEYYTQIFQNLDERVLKVMNVGLDENGYFVLYLVSQNGIYFLDSELEELLAQAKDYFGLFELNLDGNVAGIVLKNAEWFFIGSERGMDFRLDIDPDYDTATVRKNIQVALTKYLDFRFWTPGEVIQWDDLLDIVKKAEGVKYVPDEYFFPYYDEQVPINQLPRIKGFVMRDAKGNILYDNTTDLSPMFYPQDSGEVFRGLSDNSLSLSQQAYFTVVDEQNNPVEGARISVGSNSVITDANGQATLSLINGSYNYTITKQYYETLRGSFVILNASVSITNTIVLAPWTVTFNLVDEKGLPVEGAQISAGGKQTTSNINGIATLNLKNGTYPYVITKLGYEEISGKSFVISDGDININETLYFHAWQTTFTILSEADSKPIPSAIIEIGNNSYVTNSQGQVTVPLINGTYNLTIKKVGYQETKKTIVILNQDTTITYTMPLFEYNVVMTVVQEDGLTPIVGAAFSIKNSSVSGITDPNGQLSFKLVNGSYDYLLTKKEFDDLSGSFNINNSDLDLELTMTLKHFTVLISAVDENGDPVENALVNINNEVLTTNDQGQVTALLQNGNYPFTITKIGYNDYTGNVVVTDQNTSIVANMIFYLWQILFTIKGKNNLPLNNASLNIYGQTYQSDENGQIEVRLKNGTYPYSITYLGYDDYQSNLVVLNKNESIDVLMQEKTYAVIFSVTGLGGIALQGVTITVGDKSTTTNEGGIATLSLVNGSYSYTINKDGYVTSSGDFIVNNAEVPISVNMTPMSYDIVFKVTDDNTTSPNPLANVEIKINDQTLSTNNQGEVSLRIYGGDYVVSYTLAGYVSVTQEISIVKDETFEQVLKKIWNLIFSVVAATKEPLVGATVRVQGSTIIGGEKTLTTKADGTTDPIEITNGQYTYGASMEGYSPEEGSGEIKDADKTQTIDLVFGFETTFVAKEGETPIQGVSIIVDNVSILTTGTDGTAKLNLSNGQHTYTYAKDGYMSGSGNITVAGTTQSIDIALIAGGLVTFTAVYNENPLAGVEITINNATRALPQTITTNEGGIATIELPNGNYEYTTHITGYKDKEATAFTVSSANLPLSVDLTNYKYYTVDFSTLPVVEGVSIRIARPSNGVYIQDINNNLYTSTQWEALSVKPIPNGVAVVSDESSFVIAAQKSDWLFFGSQGTLITDIVTTTNLAVAKQDYLGQSNTSQIISQLGAENAPAAAACANYTFPNGRKGYLGAAGEIQLIVDNYTEIKSCLFSLLKEDITIGYFWSSTQCTADACWACSVSTNNWVQAEKVRDQGKAGQFYLSPLIFNNIDLTTNSEGKASTQLLSGTYKFTATKDKYLEVSEDFTIEQSNKSITIPMSPLSTVTFTVKDQTDSSPIKNASIKMTGVNNPGNVYIGTTDETGVATMEIQQSIDDKLNDVPLPYIGVLYDTYNYTVTPPSPYQSTSGTLEVNTSAINKEVLLIGNYDVTFNVKGKKKKEFIFRPQIGDFVYGDKTWSKILNPNKTCVGVITDVRSRDFDFVALNYLGTAQRSTVNTLVTDIVTTTVAAEANLDFKGKYNTQQWVSQIGINNLPAFKLCLEYGIGDFGAGQWYLPAAGQLIQFGYKYTDLNSKIVQAGGQGLTELYALTSTQYDTTQAWSWRSGNNDLLSSSKSNANYVRPFCTYEYNPVPNGIYIYDKNGDYFTKEQWTAAGKANADAMGVGVVTDEAQFVMSLKEGSDVQWGPDTLVNNIITAERDLASLDFKGKWNTEQIISQLGAANAPAANYCVNETFIKNEKGYLGAFGEWRVAHDNKTEVDSLLSLVGATPVFTNYGIWTSTQVSNTGAWLYYWKNSISPGVKSWSRPVRSFFMLPFKEEERGTYILGTDNKLYTQEEWQAKNPKIGDFVYSDKTWSTDLDTTKTCVGFVSSIDNGVCKIFSVHRACPFGTNVAWGNAIPSLPVFSSDRSTARADKNGRINTNVILSVKTTPDPQPTVIDDYPAANYCNNYSIEGFPQGSWYLPSCGECLGVAQIWATIKLILSANNLDTPQSQYIWTSTGYTTQLPAWIFDLNNISSGENQGNNNNQWGIYDVFPMTEIPLAVGVAVVEPESQFVIAPKENASNITWGGYGTTISGIVTTTDSVTAKQDYLGQSNTSQIISQLGAENAPAAAACANYTFPNGQTGYLGALGQWQIAYGNKAEIDACMSLIGGTAIYTSAYHWTSTQYSSIYSWILYWVDSSVSDSRKDSDRRVRAFTDLIIYESVPLENAIITPDNDTSKQVTTNAQGQAVISLKAGIDHDYSIQAEGYITREGTTGVLTSPITLDWTLNMATDFTFVLRADTESGPFIKGASIHVTSVEGSSIPIDITKETDTAGIAIFSLAEGTYDVVITAPNYKFEPLYNISVQDNVPGTLSIVGTGSYDLNVTVNRNNVGAANRTVNLYSSTMSQNTVLGEILSEMGCVLFKRTGDKAGTFIRLDKNTRLKYFDGSTAKTDGTEGDVMVYMPEYYYKYENLGGTKFAYRFSRVSLGDDWIHVPASLIGAYMCYCTGNKMYSRSGVTPTASTTWTNFNNYAIARGTGYQMIDYWQHCQIAMLFYAKYKNRNSQAVLGVGSATYNPITTAGGTDNLGNNDTQQTTSGWVNFQGIEGVHGGAYECVGGVSISNRVWTITNPDGTTRTINAGTSNGWITKMALENGPYFDMVPTAVGGSDSTYYSDYYYQSTGTYVLCRSFSSTSTYGGGVACADAVSTASYASTSVGSRLAFRGVLTESKSVSDYTAITAV